MSKLITFAAALVGSALSVDTWTVDFAHGNFERDVHIYMKAGESLRVLLDGQRGTGYRWISNLGYEALQGNEPNGAISFVEEKTLEDDQVNFFATDLESANEYKSMAGRLATYEHLFSTQPGSDFEEEIKFVYERPWLMKEDSFDTSTNAANLAHVEVFAVD